MQVTKGNCENRGESVRRYAQSRLRRTSNTMQNLLEHVLTRGHISKEEEERRGAAPDVIALPRLGGLVKGLDDRFHTMLRRHTPYTLTVSLVFQGEAA